MVEDHPTQDALEQFILGRLPATEMRSVLRHLLTGCSLCQEATGGLWKPDDLEDLLPFVDLEESSLEESVDEYEQVFDRVFSRVAANEAVAVRERALGRELFEELMHHPAARQHLLVSNSLRFRSRTLCEILLQESFETGFRDVARSLELARLAVVLVGFLEKESCGGGTEILDSLKARAWAQLGNAHRINQDHPSAEIAFAQTEPYLSVPGRIGLIDKARVLDLLASLRKDQRRFAEASQLLDRVGSVYRRLGQWHLLGRTLQQKAVVMGDAGDSETEINLLRRALDLLDPQEDPRIFLAARHNLIVALNDSGRSREAFALLFHTRPLYLKMGDRMNLLRLRWTEGIVARGLQRTDQAEAAFREVRDAFLDLGLPYDAALAALDLAHIYVLQGKSEEVCQIAEETLRIFQANNFHREAIMALMVFSSAARQQQAGIQLVRQVCDFLKQSRNDPEMRFVVS